MACKEEGVAPNDWTSYFNSNNPVGAQHNHDLKMAREAVQELLQYAEE